MAQERSKRNQQFIQAGTIYKLHKNSINLNDNGVFVTQLIMDKN